MTAGRQVKSALVRLEETQALRRAFWPAFLLTASTARTEHAIIRCISSLHSENLGIDAFNVVVLKVALESAAVNEQEDGAGELIASLPLELQRVIALPALQRQSFVLRALLGVSQDVCLRWLDIDETQLLDSVVAASLALATSSPCSDQVKEEQISSEETNLGLLFRIAAAERGQ